jgi:hypothetical protein
MWRFVILACAACVTSVGDLPEPMTRPDALIASKIDAGPKWTDAATMMIDANVSVTLSQTTNTTIVQNASAACLQNGTTHENSYYRVFDLPSHGITGSFRLKNVTFAVDDAVAMNVNVKVGTYNGTPGNQLDTGVVTSLSSGTVAVPATTNGLMMPVETDVMIPANSKLIVEVQAPSRAGLGGTFFIGATTAGQTQAGYIRAPVCGINQPVTFAAINFPNTHIILTVTGETQ